MEGSKEKVRRVKKKYIDEKYPFEVKEVFLFCLLINPPSNCTKHTLTAHRNVERKGLCTEYAKKNAVDANSDKPDRAITCVFCRDLHLRSR